MDEALLITDEVNDVLASLRHVKVCLVETQRDLNSWKWVAISLFCAVQGTIVCHCTGFSGVEALKEAHARIEMNWLKGVPTKNGQPPDSALASPETLWNRLVGIHSDFPPAGGTLSPTDAQQTAFYYLKETRNWFLHFTPKTWLISIDRIRNAIPPM